MSFFPQWFRPRPLEEQSSDRLCRLIESYLKDPSSLKPERAQARERARRAMLILGERPCSERILDLAVTAAPLGPLYLEARQALGLMGQPRAIEKLLHLLQHPSTRTSDNATVAALGHPRNAAAIPALLQTALEDRDFTRIQLAVRTLAGMGAPAEKALAMFRAAPSRCLSVVYFETPEPVYTSRLGQTPTAEELQEALRKIKSGTPPFSRSMLTYLFGDEAAATSEFESLIASPTPERAMAFEAFLLKRLDRVYENVLTAPPDDPRSRAPTKITAYPSIVTDEAARTLVRVGMRGFAARQARLMALLTPQSRGQIEALLGHALPPL